MYVTAVDLAAPTIAHFDLTVSGGCSIPDHKMIGETVLHPAHVAMVIIEHARVSLSRTAIMHDNELPTAPFHRRAADRVDNGSREIAIVCGTVRPRPEAPPRRGRWRRLQTLIFFKARLFDHDLSSFAAGSTRNFQLGRGHRRRSRSINRLWDRTCVF